MMRLKSWCWLATSVLLLCTQVAGQSFTFVPNDTTLAAPLGTEIVFDVTITNTSAQTLTLALVRTLNDLPQGWESSMCLSVCYPSTTDSILTTPEFGSSPLNPGESRPFSLHVYTATTNGTGTVRIAARNTRDNLDQRILTFHATSIPVDVRETPEAPSAYVLEQNYPNPFNPSTTIGYRIEVRGFVSLDVYDVMGREVSTIVNGVEEPGHKSVLWNASGMASGVYLYRLTVGNYSATRRLLLMK